MTIPSVIGGLPPSSGCPALRPRRGCARRRGVRIRSSHVSTETLFAQLPLAPTPPQPSRRFQGQSRRDTHRRGASVRRRSADAAIARVADGRYEPCVCEGIACSTVGPEATASVWFFPSLQAAFISLTNSPLQSCYTQIAHSGCPSAPLPSQSQGFATPVGARNALPQTLLDTVHGSRAATTRVSRRRVASRSSPRPAAYLSICYA